jgi:alkanesulfonate monooxygenase SsuD/methylene tetrahydromethanopterin reductase-like flavin-dependent oxidoreductase (luciferase family)
MKTDLVLNPFGASMPELIHAGRVAEEAGFDGLWTVDHFSGSVVGSPWSRDPFVVMGALAAVTERVQLGVLVANMTNRHAVQLASAVNSLQSLAPGRVLCGLGSGADPTSMYALEQHAIGAQIPDAPARREHLAETIAALRVVFATADGSVAKFHGAHVTIDGLGGIVDHHSSPPPIIVGASGPATIALAVEHADGVNIRRTSKLNERLEGLAAAGLRPGFEISVFEGFDPLHPHGAPLEELAALGVHRRTLMASPPYQLDAIRAIGQRLSV